MQKKTLPSSVSIGLIIFETLYIHFSQITHTIRVHHMTCNKKVYVHIYIYTRMCVFFDMYKLLEIIMKLFSQKHVS